jgi:hypothetical protein
VFQLPYLQLDFDKIVDSEDEEIEDDNIALLARGQLIMMTTMMTMMMMMMMIDVCMGGQAGVCASLAKSWAV